MLFSLPPLFLIVVLFALIDNFILYFPKDTVLKLELGLNILVAEKKNGARCKLKCLVDEMSEWVVVSSALG